jgi:hypothetical protein
MRADTTLGIACLAVCGVAVIGWILLREFFARHPLDGCLEGKAICMDRLYDNGMPIVVTWHWPVGTELWVCSGTCSLRVRVSERWPGPEYRPGRRILILNKAVFAALLPPGVTPEHAGVIDVVAWSVRNACRRTEPFTRIQTGENHE